MSSNLDHYNLDQTMQPILTTEKPVVRRHLVHSTAVSEDVQVTSTGKGTCDVRRDWEEVRNYRPERTKVECKRMEG